MFRTFRSPTVLAATRCVSGCTINWPAPPRRAGGSEPKPFAPPNVRPECEETSQTLEASPRGAAALLFGDREAMQRAWGERRKPK